MTFGNLLTYSHVGQALEKAGWALCGQEPPLHDEICLLIVENIGDHAGDPLRHIVGIAVPGGEGDSGADFSFDPQGGVAALALLFESWLPPDTEPLDRLLAMFGEAEFLPLVKGLQRELAAACDGDHLGCISPHRLAGLSGTLGFAVLSRSWSAVDAGEGDFAVARQESRKAAVAITRWLDGRG
ncbi:hypothetical protein SAMIE_1002690 [Sphingobium amiense]|uniref:Uncharacterized protein n=1 Tax=Sphingobium amiense TaxID=135719 RepID=A0A494W0Q8_9SPHN|nr:hypothetical protein [Sphingobium amiense]BBD96768.1 hypothetical protein SAMIE_1002690 [Sphingobium amiense]